MKKRKIVRPAEVPEMKGTVAVAVDHENGCEACWDAFRRVEPRNALARPVGSESGRIKTSTWERLRRCPHDAPMFARAIFVRM